MAGGPGGARNMGKYQNNGLPSRFAGGSNRPGGGFDGGRQNSRSGSKRRGASSRDKSTRKGNQSKRGGRDMREKTEEELAKEAKPPAEDVKPLEKSANRWIPKSRLAQKAEVKLAPDGSEILSTEDIERKTKSLLNKLTLEMFQEITDEILQLSTQAKWEPDAATIKQIIQLTFAKACDEPYWSEMYASFCAKICTDINPEIKDENMIVRGEVVSGGDLARRVLLNTCQSEYEKGWSDKLPTNPDGTPLEPEMMSDEYYAMAAAKRRGLGLVKFIGHLFNLNVLNDRIIGACLMKQSQNVVDPSEETLESLAQLVKTVGPKIDTSGNPGTKAALRLVFERIGEILNNEELKLPSRIKFMLMDLQDLRDANWSSAKSDAGPKTIEQIHRDAEIKRLQEQRASIERRQKKSYDSGRSNSSRSGSAWNNNNNNNNASSGSSNNFLNNLKKSPSYVNQRSPSSGPSSSDLQREASKRSESTHVNRFAALGDGEDDDNE
ncbi:uncharacterized protein SPAPADRAFT_60225 [Spathaspora passalidarum NRRL Y-27907]|uniref:MIF4G domain-containing protein n=1 Tax=Spathaspora passalidarum (strain NRRL Y-27907 / 11-Y1) TaxID=619300 RepID=G3AK70_SPAPN|nr:uncharacterized protein SPAPADRAFT_60225 [Spathaspora passalidarum NRRL Y-27907]EGW32882.1 hypothetical protein SPAPADRAFT_60225 [Spathaspora passalidarum NRRL Y-27907]